MEKWRIPEVHLIQINSRFLNQPPNPIPDPTNSYDPFGLTLILPEETPRVPFSPLHFLLLTWASLRVQHHSATSLHQSPYAGNGMTANGKNGGYFKDSGANVVKFSFFPTLVMKDKRGWLINPVSLALEATVPGGALSCVSVHVGEIRPGGLRGTIGTILVVRLLYYGELRQCSGWKIMRSQEDTLR